MSGYTKDMCNKGNKATKHETPGHGTVRGDVFKPKVSGAAGKRRKYTEMGKTAKQVFGK